MPVATSPALAPGSLDLGISVADFCSCSLPLIVLLLGLLISVSRFVCVVLVGCRFFGFLARLALVIAVLSSTG
jgi:hypothetical protein